MRAFRHAIGAIDTMAKGNGSNVLRNTSADADKAAAAAKLTAFNAFVASELTKIATAESARNELSSKLDKAIAGVRGTKEKVMIACGNYANANGPFDLTQINAAIAFALSEAYSDGKGGITLADPSRDNLASLLRNAMDGGYCQRIEKDFRMAGTAYTAEENIVKAARAKAKKDGVPFVMPENAPLHRKWSKRESMVKALSSLGTQSKPAKTNEKTGKVTAAVKPIVFDNAKALIAYASDAKTGVPANSARPNAITAALKRVLAAIDGVRAFGSCEALDEAYKTVKAINASAIKSGSDAENEPKSKQESAVSDNASDIDVDEAMSDDEDPMAAILAMQAQMAAMVAKLKK